MIKPLFTDKEIIFSLIDQDQKPNVEDRQMKLMELAQKASSLEDRDLKLLEEIAKGTLDSELENN